MGDNSASFHESEERLRPQTMDHHRAIASLMEELEAVDWYDQRIDATGDPDLRAILVHNRDEEKEHAAMVLEWLRRRDPEMDRFLREYLFTEGSIVALEAEAEGGGGDGAAAGNGNGAAGTGAAGLGIGSLRRRS
ncbi:MAG TPA: encapsulin-associated ferritin-like protein [Acidimicrobiia bacterium]|nr:encapsulin-associated ferritin-like protein [Acidimicrobiia bacterium]